MLKRMLWLVPGLLLLGIISLFLWFYLSSEFRTVADPRSRPHSYYINNSVEIERPPEIVFDYVQRNIPRIYRELSGMHDTFEIVNAEMLTEGAEIECIEGDEESIVHSHYIVTKVVQDEQIYFESVPTMVFSRKSNKLITTMDVYVHFDFEKLSTNRMKLHQTIVMVPASPFFKALLDAMAFLTGNRDLWAEQFRDELVNFKPLIEAHT